MSFFDVLYAELTGGKVSAKERRAFEREAEEMLNRLAWGVTGPPPLIQTTDGQVFQYVGFGLVPPRGVHLCGLPPVLTQDGTAKRSPHNCHVYQPAPGRRIKNARPFYPPGARQEAPPPPRRPSGPNPIEGAYNALGAAPEDTAAQIRARFISLSKQFHPDTHPGDAEAERRYKEITAAYTLLKGAKLV